jgi:predicted membrane protein
MKLFHWIAFNAFILACMYYGFYAGIDGAKNLAMFIAWLCIVTSFAAYLDGFIESIRDKTRAVPEWVNWSFDIPVTFAFVWFGATTTGIFYFIHIVNQQHAWNKIEALNKAGE